MKNLEQIRAMNALAAIEGTKNFKGIQEGDALSGFPALIIGNGLLASIAFSLKQKDGYEAICNAIAVHLADSAIRLFAFDKPDARSLLKYLCDQDSSQLRLCTAESLAYLNYLRRFAKAENKTKVENGE
jgi:CRISPR type III-B/RAMP module-associated protein Cmr5